MNTVALVIAVIIFIVGLLGTVLPVLPGVMLIYAGMLLYGFMTGFATLNVYFFVMQGIVVGIVILVDYVASAVGTKLSGGSRQAAIGAVIGTILGLILLGPLGIIVGPFVGAVAVELSRGAAPARAVRVGFGTLIGTVGGTVIKLGAAVAMIVYFFVKAL